MRSPQGGFEGELGAEGDGVEGALECGVAHAGGDHEVFFEGRAGEGEAALVALRGRFRGDRSRVKSAA